MSFEIYSYNLLVPIYADQPEYYSKCHPEHLETQFRLKLIKSQLEHQMSHQKNVIICLQELCQTFVELLQPFFQRNQYRLIHKLYGGAHNDYMGVGIAIPNSIKIQSHHSIKVGDHVRPLATKPSKSKGNVILWLKNFFRAESIHLPRLNMSSEEMARNVSNQLLIVDVDIDGIRLSIGTYHMPCMYKYPDVMQMHASTVRYLMSKHSQRQSWILAGDFNFNPDDPCYDLVREEHVHSAYESRNGVEPKFTNFAWTSASGAFCATLDYIFYCGRNLRVRNVLSLPDRPETDSYPDAENPSDHLMIGASFHFI